MDEARLSAAEAGARVTVDDEHAPTTAISPPRCSSSREAVEFRPRVERGGCASGCCRRRRAKERYGPLHRTIVRDRKGELVGCYLYHGKPGGIGRVLQVLARPERPSAMSWTASSARRTRRGSRRSAAARAAAHRTRSAHAKCFFVHRASTVVHTADRELAEPCETGGALITGPCRRKLDPPGRRRIRLNATDSANHLLTSRFAARAPAAYDCDRMISVSGGGAAACAELQDISGIARRSDFRRGLCSSGCSASCAIAVLTARASRCDDGAGLAHTRLSIIDLAAGAQPMSNDDGTVSITFNGEIFNYIELRRRADRARPQVPHHAPTPKSSSASTRRWDRTASSG